VIRFSALLVAVALGLLVAGVVTSSVLLVYLSIGVSCVALLAWGVGALIKRGELFGQTRPAGPRLAESRSAESRLAAPQLADPKLARPEPAWPEQANVRIQPAKSASQAPPWEATMPASGRPVETSPAEASPADAMARNASVTAWESGTRSPGERGERGERSPDPWRPAAFTPRPSAPAPGVPAPTPGTWEWRGDAPVTQPLPRAVDVPPSASSAAAAPTVASPLPGAPVPAEPLAAEDLASETASETPETLDVPEALKPPDSPPAADDERPAEDQHSPETQHAAEDEASGQPTQQLPVPSAPEPEPAAPEPEPASAAPEPEPGSAAVDLQREVTVVPGVPRYHSTHCLLIRFMDEDDLEKTTLGAARQAGCTPCRACLPDEPEPGAEEA